MKENEKRIKLSSINPVDHYNNNHVQDALEVMLNYKNVVSTSINSFSYVENKNDKTKKMFVIENNRFVPKMDNGLNLEIDMPYTPFQMLQKFKFKDKFWPALNYVIITIMNNECEYVRIGFKYFKLISKTDRNGVVREELKVWEKSTIIDDYNRDYLDIIPRFDDFTIIPDNKNHSRIVGNNYNLYSEFSHNPCIADDYQGELGWYWSKTLMEHVFGEQYESGLKYMKFLYDMPQQILPILVLTSQERVTGKSTFVDWLCVIFGDNMVVVNPQDISNSFNGTYADKNIIAIEESRFEGTQTLEKLKALATQKKLTVNTKFVQQYSVPFYGKLIITSNDEQKFSRVDESEIRYWVRKIPTLKGKANHNILAELTKEIPQFLHYLDTLPKPDNSKSRMGLTAEEISTDALDIVKRESLPGLHKDIQFLLEEHCMANTKVKQLEFSATELKQHFYRHNHKIEINYINRILKDSLQLTKAEKVRKHIPFELDNNINQTKVNGRVYIYENKYYGDKTEINQDNL